MDELSHEAQPKQQQQPTTLQETEESSSSSTATKDALLSKLPKKICDYIKAVQNKINKTEENRSNNQRTTTKLTNNFDSIKKDRLWNMKTQGKYIDAILVAENGFQESVHLDVLLNLDSNIKQSFKFSKEISETVKEFLVDPSITSSVLETIIRFAYHGKCDLTIQSAIQVAMVAESYQIGSLLLYCIEHLLKNCNTAIAVKSFELASNELCQNLDPTFNVKKAFKRFIDEYFEKIWHESKNDFLKLDLKLVLELIKSNELNLTNEHIIWDIINEWISFDTCNRLSYFEQLLKEGLRFGRLGENFVRETIYKSAIFLNQPQFVQLSIGSFIQSNFNNKRLIVKDGYKLLYSKTNFYFMPRKTRNLMVVAGGWVEGKTTNSLEIYDYQSNLWLTSQIKLPKNTSYFGLEIIDSTIYVFGGSNGQQIFKTLQAVDLNQNTLMWRNKCSMIECRCYVSSAVLDGHIYAIGGFNQRIRIRKCERYNPVTDSWVEIADLNYARSDASAISHNGRIYIAGGINDQCIERTVEVYHPSQNTWVMVKAMESPRTSFSIASFHNKIWALGGNSGDKRLKSVEVYDPDSDMWIEAPDMLTCRSTFKAVVLHDQLFVVGGYNGQSPICNVEKYTLTEGWIQIKELRHDRSGLSLLSFPNNFDLIKI